MQVLIDGRMIYKSGIGRYIRVAKTSSMPEAVCDAGVYFDPYNIEDMGAQIYNVLKDELLRNSLKKKGIEQAQKFNWTKTASDTLEVFRKVSGKNYRRF